MRIHANTKPGWIVQALAALAVGCAGGAPPVGVADSDLVISDLEPLEELEGDEENGAEPGCDGRLTGGERFALVSDGLVAAVDADGEVVCVDTVEAIEEELEEAERTEEAECLVISYVAAMARRATTPARFRRSAHQGDPDPEPNLDFSRFRRAGGPAPEPKVGT
jgi:hypothetical protein